jgi:predicted amidohydrolase YtcJ
VPGGLLLISTRLPLVTGALHTDGRGDRDGPRVDVRVTGGVIEAIGPGLRPRPGETVVDCAGGALLPGLCDHHLHLHALAAWRGSVPCGPPEVRDGAQLGAVLAAAPADRHGWVRGVGYVDTVLGRLDAQALDRLHPSRPVRIQHRGGSMWMLNSAAVSLLQLASADHPGIERDAGGAPTGLLWRADDWLRARLPSTPPDLSGVGRELTALGITAVTDATPDLDDDAVASIAAAAGSAALPQQVTLLGAPLAAGPGAIPYPRSGRPGRAGGSLAVGPYKIVLADSGLPALDDLTARIAAAHRVGRPVALHCVTEVALVLLLAALDEAGVLPGDRIEHAGLVPESLIPTIAGCGITVVTQPGFLAHRGEDFVRDLPAAQHTDLYRCRSLMSAGVPVALSSDAPYGPLDPWAVIAAAVDRRAGDGSVIGPRERLDAWRALAAYLGAPGDPGGRPRTVQVGGAGDLVVLRAPLSEALRAPNHEVVRAVVIGGELMSGD